MNNAQIESLLTKLIIAGLTGLAAKYGFSSSELQDFAVDLSTFLLAIGTMAFSHSFHATGTGPYNGPQKVPAILLIVALCLCASGARAQSINPTNIVGKITTNAVQQTAVDKAINALDIGITNYSVDLYGTYAPSAPAGSSKWGGGIMGMYDFNQNAAAGIGLDWLGGFSLVSANLQLQAPFHLSTLVPSLANIPVIGTMIITPIGIAGVGTPYSGNGHFNGSPMAIVDAGGAVQFGHVLGGQLNAGIAWGKWMGQGPYGNIARYHAFFGYSHGLGAVGTVSTTASLERAKDRFAAWISPSTKL